MLKKILTVSAAMLLTLASYVAAVEVRDDHPDTYVVQKGDTLWDIAARFLNEPWLWPEIWQANPQVENPHLIYPGDVLSLAYLGGRATLIKKSPTARRVGGEAIDALPLGEIEPFLKKAHVLDEDTYRSLPYVVSLEENRLRSTEGQIAYVRGGSFEPGQTWAVLRPTVRYSARPNKDGTDRGLRSVPWDAQHGANPLVSPEWAYIQEMSDRHEVLGYEAIEITQGVVTRGGDPATLLITPGGHEVKQGDLLIPYDPQPYDLSFYPRAMDNVPPDVRILAQTDRLHFGGPRDVIAISAGAREGVENGHVFAIYHPGDLVRDEIAHPRRLSANREKNKVQMPDEFVGHVMVFRTFDKISYGLIMDGIRPAKIGDRLVAPERRR